METSNGVDETKPVVPEQASPEFIKKPVETPILDSDVRKQITVSDGASSESGGFRDFFRTNKYYFLAILVGVVLISVLAYFAFKKSPPVAPKDANVSISVDVPGSIASGSEAVYTVNIQNNDNQKLVNLEMELAYSDGMTFVNSGPSSFTPENLSATLFKMPDLLPGQSPAVFLKIKVTGNVNDQKTLNIKLHYKYANFSANFIKEQSSTVKLLASDVMVELDGPSTTNNAQIVLYTVKYQNNSGKDIANTRIKMDYPAGFVFASATPPPDLGSDTWDIGTLANAGQGTIQIQGTFNSSNPGESKTAMAEYLILGPDGQYSTQNTSSFVTTVSSLPLLVTQQLQSADSSGVVNPGQTLNFTIHYQNNASTVATGVNVQITLDSKAVDLSTIRTQGAQVNNNTIIWNASGVPQLQSLLPNQSGDLSLSVKINNPAVKDSTKNVQVVSSVQIQANEYTSAFPGGKLALKISSPSSINTVLSFVSGQLPPQVGKNTVYKVKFALANSSNDFSNGSLTAFIPTGFVPSSETLAETNNVKYDPSTSKLIWNVGSLPANTGRFSQPRVLEFQVTLNPSSTQINQSPVLVKTINFTANDIFTGQNVSISADDITTSDVSGQNGFGNGQVTQ